MSDYEIIIRLFEVKKEKGIHIASQSYEKAAQTRDLERGLEKNLLEVNLIKPKDKYDELFEQVKDYFISKWGTEYSISYKEQIHRQFIRQYKLINLGI